MPLENFDDIDLPRHPGGRPRSAIDLGVVERAAPTPLHQRGNAIVSSAYAHSTFFKHLLENPEIQEVIDRGYDMGRTTLRRAQWKRRGSIANPTMLICAPQATVSASATRRALQSNWTRISNLTDPTMPDPQRDPHP